MLNNHLMCQNSQSIRIQLFSLYFTYQCFHLIVQIKWRGINKILFDILIDAYLFKEDNTYTKPLQQNVPASTGEGQLSTPSQQSLNWLHSGSQKHWDSKAVVPWHSNISSCNSQHARFIVHTWTTKKRKNIILVSFYVVIYGCTHIAHPCIIYTYNIRGNFQRYTYNIRIFTVGLPI